MRFRFEAFDQAGNLVQGDVDAATELEARQLVETRGAVPYELSPVRTPALFTGRTAGSHSGRRLHDMHVSRLARDLAVLLSAGVPLDAALRITSETAEDQSTRTTAQALLQAVLEGTPLAQAMERMQGAFRPEHVRIVEAGEAGAALGSALGELADLLDRRIEIRNRVRGALAYPALLVVLAAVSLWIVMGFLLPAVTPIFLESGLDLPPVIAALDWVRVHSELGLLAIGGTAAAIAAAMLAGRGNPAFALAAHRLLLKVPVIGRVLEVREAGRFARTLATLIRAGVPALQALQTAVPLVGNRHVRDRLEEAVTDVRAGASLGSAIGRTHALPPVARQMISVGEESGRLSEMLLRAALVLERQEQNRTARALAVLTPAVTILIACLIAAIILSVMGAILSINELALL
jgi:general secretion pathway protein F